MLEDEMTFNQWDKWKSTEDQRVAEEIDRNLERLEDWLERLARLADQSTPA